MRIIHLTSVHSLNDTRITLKMCASLVKAGHEVHIIGPDFNASPKRLPENIHFHTVAPPKNRLDRMVKVAKKVFQTGAQLNGDIYHFHDPECLRLALHWQRKLKRPFVYDIHEDYRENIHDKPWLPALLRPFVASAFAKQEDWITAQLAGLITATPTIARHFRLHPHLETICNYPLLEEFSSDLTGNKKRPGAFAYIGAIAPSRGTKEMIEALTHTKENARLQLAGNFISHDFYNECAAMPGWKLTDYAGFLDRTGVQELLSQAIAGLVVLHPTRAYIPSLPVKMFEYMSSGLPVIASDFPIWRQIITDSNCGRLVNPLNPKEIANAMNQIMSDPGEAHEMGKRGRKAITEKYNWEAEFPKLISFYEQLASDF